MSMDDRTPNFGEAFREGERFVLCGLRRAGNMKTVHGDAQKSELEIVSRSHPTVKRVYTALGAGIAEQAENAEPGDFPRVVELVKIPLSGDRTVKKLVKVEGTDPSNFIRAGVDGDPLAPSATVDTPATGAESTDIGF